MLSIDDVKSNVEFCPYVVRGVHSKPLSDLDETHLDQQESDAFIAFLRESKWGSALEKDFNLQSVCERSDGTGLLSAFVPVGAFVDMLTEAGTNFKPVLLKARKWAAIGECNEVIVHFVDNRANAEDR